MTVNTGNGIGAIYNACMHINQHTKFEVSSFTYSKDMTGAPKFKI